MFEVIHNFTQLSSCVGSSSCGVGGTVTFGATDINTATGKGFLADVDNGNGSTFTMWGSNQGMYNTYAGINAYWSDTTLMVRTLCCSTVLSLTDLCAV
jgi:hypothetical protein